ncbi:phage repressor protein/antirepressor Ant [Clostridiales bacterium]|nr:phage repressor protein/antirepressor Ant [Clostridiales bacterium]
MKELQIFKNEQFGQVRTIEEDGKVLFCGSDCAKALGYQNPSRDVNRHCKNIEKRCTTDSVGRQQETLFIPEGDLYRLITHSKLPAAEKFESWVFDEVLPSIRKHGMYATDELLNDPDLLISVAQELKKEKELRRELQEKVEQDKPKTLFADAVSTSSTSILIGELAKILKQNGYDTGEKRLFAWLRDNGYLIRRKGTDYNAPTQKSMELGLFEVKETAITHSDGHVTVNKTTKVTGKGQQYFIDKFLAEVA